jgi:hypothetical protein
MSPNRPNLILDEQSFEGLLSAAFTIQEHNDHIKQARQTKASDESRRLPANIVCRLQREKKTKVIYQCATRRRTPAAQLGLDVATQSVSGSRAGTSSRY